MEAAEISQKNKTILTQQRNQTSPMTEGESIICMGDTFIQMGPSGIRIYAVIVFMLIVIVIAKSFHINYAV